MTKSRSGCQIGTTDSGAVGVPWHGTVRGADKRKLAQYVLYEPSGAPLSKIVRDVFDSDAVESAGADYQLARRFFERYDHFKTERCDGYLWVEPRDWALLLKSSRQDSADTDDAAVDLSNLSGTLPSRAPAGRAAQTARSVLRDRCEITPAEGGDGVRAALRHALAAHREGVDTEGMQEDRVSAPSRVAARQEKYLSAFEIAAHQYDRGVMCTLTSRPGESGDMVDSAVAVNESINPLRDHLKRQTPGSGRPPAVIAREVADRGMLHLHVVVFGVGEGCLNQNDLGRYWYETRGHGYISDATELQCHPKEEAHRWVFSDHTDAATERGQYARAYLGEMLCKLRDVAEATPEEIHASEGRGWWKVALLWSCGLPVVSISDSLREQVYTANICTTV